MTGGREIKNNALRLASALERHVDRRNIKVFAANLNYEERQLSEDIVDLRRYIEALENKLEELGAVPDLPPR